MCLIVCVCSEGKLKLLSFVHRIFVNYQNVIAISPVLCYNILKEEIIFFNEQYIKNNLCTRCKKHTDSVSLNHTIYERLKSSV